jgi:hypothetical protein
VYDINGFRGSYPGVSYGGYAPAAFVSGAAVATPQAVPTPAVANPPRTYDEEPVVDRPIRRREPELERGELPDPPERAPRLRDDQ